MEATNQPRPAQRFKWSDNEIAFIRQWYGKIPLADLANILNKRKVQIHEACRRRLIKASDRIKQDVVVTYNGKKHLITYQPTRYVTTWKDGKRTCIDTQKVYVKKVREKKVKVGRPEPAEVKIKTFEAPKGKTLVKIDSKTWAYR